MNGNIVNSNNIKINIMYILVYHCGSDLILKDFDSHLVIVDTVYHIDQSNKQKQGKNYGYIYNQI